jgi:hypothetical protein
MLFVEGEQLGADSRPTWRDTGSLKLLLSRTRGPVRAAARHRRQRPIVVARRGEARAASSVNAVIHGDPALLAVTWLAARGLEGVDCPHGYVSGWA